MTSGRPRDEKVLRWGAGVLVGFLVAGTSLVVLSLLVDGSDAVAPGASRPTPSSTASALPTTAITSVGDSPTPRRTPRLTAARMTAFLDRYLATAPDDQRASWRLLTPGFQRASGGFSGYAGFWGPIAGAEASGVFADPAARRITYRVRYRYPDGRAFVDSTRLELRMSKSGKIRIAGEG